MGYRLSEREALALATHRHYKGGLYRVISIGPHTETNEEMVIYVHLFPHQVRVYPRPASIFYQLKDGEPRFKVLDDRDPARRISHEEMVVAVTKVMNAMGLGLPSSAAIPQNTKLISNITSGDFSVPLDNLSEALTYLTGKMSPKTKEGKPILPPGSSLIVPELHADGEDRRDPEEEDKRVFKEVWAALRAMSESHHNTAHAPPDFWFELAMEIVSLIRQRDTWVQNAEVLLRANDNGVLRYIEEDGTEDLVRSVVLTLVKTRNQRDVAVGLHADQMKRIAGFEERTNALGGKTAEEWKAACEAAEQRAADLSQKLTNLKAGEVGL